LALILLNDKITAVGTYLKKNNNVACPKYSRQRAN